MPEDRGTGRRRIEVGDPQSADANPGAITMQRVHVKDFVFAVRVAGPKAGEAVILLHGFPESSYEWRPQSGRDR